MVSPAFLMYPNPAENDVMLQMPQAGRYNLSITDQWGRALHHQEIDQKGIINTNSYPNGLYLITIEGDDGYQKTQKLIITR